MTINDLIIFIYDSGICLTILFGMYWFFLRKETYFHFNRFYLLSTIIVACILPLGNINLSENSNEISALGSLTSIAETIRIPAVTIIGESKNVYNPSVNWQHLAFVIYLTGASLIIVRIILGIIRVTMLRRRGRRISLDGYSIVYIKQELAPFSFFRTVYISDRMVEGQDKSYIISHELIHIKQQHTYDNLLVEFFLAIFWFNPFMWLLRGALRNTHEYLADKGVLSENTSLPVYQFLLLKQIIGSLPLVVSNSFNSSIKNRIKMMYRNRSSVLAKFKPVLLVPIITCLLLVFSCKEKPGNLTVENSQKESVQEEPEISEAINSEEDIQEEAVVSGPESNDQDAEEDEIQEESDLDDREIFYIVEEMPTFKGKEAEEFKHYIAQNLRYPEIAAENGTEGRVIVQFVINMEGKLVDASIVRSVDQELDKEAIRVVESAPDEWTPGKQRGEPVEVIFSFPINFVIQ